MKHFGNIYSSVLINENIFKEGVGLETKTKHKIEVFFFVILGFLKVSFLKVFWRDKKRNFSLNPIALIWAKIHQSKLEKLNLPFEYVEVTNRNLLLNKGLNFFLKKVSLRKCILFSVNIKNKKASDFFSYRLYISFLIEFFDAVLQNRDNVFISGHFDRNSIIISNICRIRNIKLNIVQHGAIQIFEKQMVKSRINGDIYYQFEFSKSFFRTFLNYGNNTKFIKQPDVDNGEFFYQFDGNHKVIVYGCQDAKVELNLKILDFLVNQFPYYLIYIIPHPREEITFYKKRYSHLKTVISRKKPINVEFFVSRFSTLGIEYSNVGVKSIFVNLDKVKMDFILSGDYNVCESLNQLKMCIIEN